MVIWKNKRSISQLEACHRSGDSSELLFDVEDEEGLHNTLFSLGISQRSLPFEAALPATRAHREYRKRGGSKTSPLSDFFIGAHAQAEGLTILTRDPKRYASYFPEVPLISP